METAARFFVGTSSPLPVGWSVFPVIAPICSARTTTKAKVHVFEHDRIHVVSWDLFVAVFTVQIVLIHSIYASIYSRIELPIQIILGPASVLTVGILTWEILIHKSVRVGPYIGR